MPVNKMTILVVEDDKIMCELFDRMLAPLGVVLVFVEKLVDALIQMAKIPPPDFVILDLRLTDSFSSDTVARIPELQVLNPKAPIVVVTGNTDEKLEQAARALGVDDYIYKPHISRQSDTYKAIWKIIRARMDAGQTMNEAVTEVFNRLNTLVNESKP